MPEGPEVKKIAESLNNHLASKVITEIFKTNNNPRHNAIEGFNQLVSLLPLRIGSISSKGKKIIFQLTTLSSPNQMIYLVSSLGTKGSWIFNPTKHADIYFKVSKLIPISGVSNILLDDVTLYYDDSIHYGVIKLAFNVESFSKIISNIGHDVLSEGLSKDIWLSVVKNPKLSKKQICWLIMEQKYFSGVGNYIKAESLYRSKIRPDRLVADIKDDELELLRTSILAVINESYQANGLTIKDYKDPEGRLGNFITQVYGRNTDPYGNLVIKTQFGDKRTSHWVPNIQV